MIDKFKPEIWSQKIKADLLDGLVGLNFVNSDYEGEIKDKGDTVHIIAAGSVPVEDNDWADFAWDDVSDDELLLLINKSKRFHFKVRDIDKIQSQANLIPIYTSKAVRALAEALDSDIFKTLWLDHKALYDADGAATNAKYNLIDSIALSSANVYDTVVDVKAMLKWNKVPGRNLRLGLSPDEIQLLEKTDRFIKDSKAVDIVRAGWAGQISGIDVFESHNLYEDDPAVILAGVQQATTLRERTSNVAKITVAGHGYQVGDLIRVESMGDATYNTPAGTWEAITAKTTNTISYASTGSDETSTADVTGRVNIKTLYNRYLPIDDPIAVTFANQIGPDHVEAARLEKNFSDGVKGYNLYGQKEIYYQALGFIKAIIGYV